MRMDKDGDDPRSTAEQMNVVEHNGLLLDLEIDVNRCECIDSTPSSRDKCAFLSRPLSGFPPKTAVRQKSPSPKLSRYEACSICSHSMEI